MLAKGHVRLVRLLTRFGYGLASFDLHRPEDWKTAGRGGHLAGASVVNGGSTAAWKPPPRSERGEALLQFSGEFADAGGSSDGSLSGSGGRREWTVAYSHASAKAKGVLLSRWVGPALTGLLLALCFPPYHLWPLVFVALGPLLASLCTGGGFGRGYLMGLVFLGLLISWMRYLTPFGEQAYAGLVLYRALFYGLFGALFAAVRTRRGVTAALLTAPFLWAGVEYVSSLGPLGFPWGLMGQPLWGLPPLIQIAEVGSTYILAVLLVGVNAAFVALGFNLRVGPPYVVGALLLLSADLAYGAWRLTVPLPEGPRVWVALVQGNVPQEVKVTAEGVMQMWAQHRRLTLRRVRGRAQVVVWPETALPTYLPWSLTLREGVSALARVMDAALLIGSVDVEDERTIYNSAFVVEPNGRFGDVYHKVHLVVFGEYTPFKEQLPFMRIFSVRDPDYTAGTVYGPVRTPGGAVGTPICYESTFPQIARQFVRRGAEWLCVITNDAWFDGTGETLQHASLSVFRAIETRRWVARCANTGLTGFISPQGFLTATVPLQTEAVAEHEITRQRTETFYVRYGDVFAWLCLAVSAGALGKHRTRR